MIACIAAWVCSGVRPNWLARFCSPAPPCALWMMSFRVMAAVSLPELAA